MSNNYTKVDFTTGKVIDDDIALRDGLDTSTFTGKQKAFYDAKIETPTDPSMQQSMDLVNARPTETFANYGEKRQGKREYRVGAIATLLTFLKKLGIGTAIGGVGFMVASGPIIENIENQKQKALEDSVRIKNEESMIGVTRPNELPDNPTPEQIQELNDATNIYNQAQGSLVSEDGSITSVEAGEPIQVEPEPK